MFHKAFPFYNEAQTYRCSHLLWDCMLAELAIVLCPALQTSHTAGGALQETEAPQHDTMVIESGVSQIKEILPELAVQGTLAWNEA
jgi:hypothetical protein